MRHFKATTLRTLRDYLVKKAGGLKPRRFARQDAALCRRLDESLLGFRAARRLVADADKRNWLSSVRRATGVPASVLAKRLGVSETEVFRLEKAERERRLGVANLQRAAEALGCELVYALVPAEGSLEDLAAEEREVREAARAMAEQSRRQNKDRIERWLDMDEATRRQMRKTLRKMGIRVR